jgi:hypothetical protein
VISQYKNMNIALRAEKIGGSGFRMLCRKRKQISVIVQSQQACERQRVQAALTPRYQQ